MRRVEVKQRAKVSDVLRFVNDNLDILLPLTKKGVYRMRYAKLPDWQDYAPASVYLAADKLVRQGLVEKTETINGTIIRITDRGKKRVLQYDLAHLSFARSAAWDGQWRLVFFDISEIERSKRDKLRYYLQQLGMEKMQESVFVSPYDVFDQVEYIREVLEVPNGVKLAKLSWIENQDELKLLFDLN